MPDLARAIENEPASLDDVVETAADSPSSQSIDDKFRLDDETSFGKKVFDIGLQAGFYAGQIGALSLIPGVGLLAAAKVAATTLITSVGFLIGGRYEAKKEGKKYTWKRATRDWRGGNIFGYIDYFAFAVPDLFANYIGYFAAPGLMPMIAKWLFFEATVVPSVVAGYNAVEYIRNEMGWMNFFRGLFSIKNNSLKEVYQKGVKGTILRDSKKIWTSTGLLHFPQINLIDSMPLRMAQSAFVNNSIFRYVMGKKEKKPDYAPSYYRQPRYALNPAY